MIFSGAKFNQEKKDLERKYKEKVKDLEDQLEQERHMLEIERDRFKAKFKREKDKYGREVKDMRSNVEEQISLDMQQRMEVRSRYKYVSSEAKGSISLLFKYTDRPICS